jgi:hypothetical protein
MRRAKTGVPGSWISFCCYVLCKPCLSIRRFPARNRTSKEAVFAAWKRRSANSAVALFRIINARDRASPKAIKGVRPNAKRRGSGATDPYHAALWVLGDAIGEACWLQGHTAGMRRKAPAEGKIRIDLSPTELLQLSWLAQLGFRHMMPNYRGFEIHRFSGEADAREGALAISRIESAVPAKDRPFADLVVQLRDRQKMISDWWQATPGRLIA